MSTNPNTPTLITDARRAAARANGAKSRGPITPEGKAISAQNARHTIRHGLFAKAVVLEGEDEGAFLSFLATLKKTLAPRDETQHGLVETIAAARWRSFRLNHILNVIINREVARLRGIPSRLETSNMGYIATAYRNLNGGVLSPDSIALHELRLERQVHRALNLLLQLQGKKPQGKTDRTQDVLDSLAHLPAEELVWDPNDRDNPHPDPLPNSPVKQTIQSTPVRFRPIPNRFAQRQRDRQFAQMLRRRPTAPRTPKPTPATPQTML